MSHLCFGSYATIIRKYYLGTDKDVVDDLFSSIKEGTDIDKSKVSLLINSKDNVQGYIIETSQSQRVLTSIGDYFSDYIIPNLKSKSLTVLLKTGILFNSIGPKFSSGLSHLFSCKIANRNI